MMMKSRTSSILALAICVALLLATPCSAVTVVDSGTPDQSSNRSVFVDSTLPGAQFAAQEFTLSIATTITNIETYLGGSGSDPIDAHLSTTIGIGTVVGDVVSSFTLLPPGTAPNAGAWVAESVNLNLGAGTYYMVYSAVDGDDGAFLPIDAPNDIGPSFLSIKQLHASRI